jgi:hypothetical protein
MNVEFLSGQFLGDNVAQVTLDVDGVSLSDAAVGIDIFDAMAKAIAKVLRCEGQIHLKFSGVQRDVVRECYVAEAGFSGDCVSGEGYWPITIMEVLAGGPVKALGWAMTTAISQYVEYRKNALVRAH